MLALAGCAASQGGAPGQAPTSPAEIGVQRAVLRDVLRSRVRSDSAWVFNEARRFGWDVDSAAVWGVYARGTTPYTSPGVPGLSRQMFQALLTANRRESRIAPAVIERLPARWAKRRDLQNSTWTGTLVVFSRVGVSTGGDSALVHYSALCPGLCGISKLVLYTRSDTGWVHGGTLEDGVH